MTIREAIQNIQGFRYMMEQLNVRSAAGRRFLLDIVWMNSPEEVKRELERVVKMGVLLQLPERKTDIETLGVRLMQLRDIRGTILRVSAGCVLDDLELFELKNFALLLTEIRHIAGDWGIVSIPVLDPVVALLDPEGNRIPHFYIYDIYSPELAALRAEISVKKQQGEAEEEIEKIYVRSVEIEDQVRESLSEELHGHSEILQQALEAVALLDVVLAKAEQAADMQLVCPELEGEEAETITLEGLFHPQVRMKLRQEGKEFQPVDLKLNAEATVITGANMAGKTVLLKSVALAQYLVQFGFFVPASRAKMSLLGEVMMSIGDEQNELSGLSSFAAEMIRMNEMVGKVKDGRKILVLIDELARTTNPVEGRAIVNGVVDFLTKHRTMAMVTTHYNGIIAPCRRLRVKGFVEDKIKGEVTLKNINEYIDYSLEEDRGNEVPHEAMRIAWMLGVDTGILQTAERFLTDRQEV